MISRYGVFCRVLEEGSFTRAAEQLGYSQSAVSQTIRGVEKELGVTLIDRKTVALTADGAQFFPYIQAVCAAEQALAQKRDEMAGLENTVIRIGTFTGISRTVLPPLMKTFQERYPAVSFLLKQGDYTDIEGWILDGSVDFGFLNGDSAVGVETQTLYEDELMAVLPPDHPLAAGEGVSLAALVPEPFLLLEEGERSVVEAAFRAQGLSPQVKYRIYDDYTILAMVRQGLGVSLLYRNVLDGFDHGTAVRPIRERPGRRVALAWKSKDTMPYAARRFADFVIRRL